MAVRVTATEVKGVITTTLTDDEITPYITSANVYVTARLGSSALIDAVLKEIERWMTAHMIASTKTRQEIEAEAGSAKIKYSDNYDTGLKSTSFGQMCISLDTTGLLAQEGKKPISMQVLTSLENYT